MRRILIVLALLTLVSGCTRLRFVIDTIPAEDGLVETVVLEDGNGRPLFDYLSKIALIDVNGLIADAKRRGVISRGENPVARFAEALRRAEQDLDVKAIIVRINSRFSASALATLVSNNSS